MVRHINILRLPTSIEQLAAKSFLFHPHRDFPLTGIHEICERKQRSEAQASEHNKHHDQSGQGWQRTRSLENKESEGDSVPSEIKTRKPGADLTSQIALTVASGVLLKTFKLSASGECLLKGIWYKAAMKRENQNHSANEQAALAQDEARDGFLPRAQLVDLLGQRSIVLIGIMGSGKSTVGRRLAHRMGLKFVDADNAIQEAANMTIPEIFASHGEAYFRSGEERVIARLLQEGPQVLATGGGAYMSGSTREAIAEAGISIWLNADFETVMARVRKRTSRPLLQTPDPEGTMRQLMADRYPIYAKADVEIHSRDVPHETVAEDIMIGLSQYLLSTSASNGTRDLEVPVAD